jgi:hypothetical protein
MGRISLLQYFKDDDFFITRNFSPNLDIYVFMFIQNIEDIILFQSYLKIQFYCNSGIIWKVRC